MRDPCTRARRGAGRHPGSRLAPLTTGRAEPSLPVGGNHRLMDVALSNARHPVRVGARRLAPRPGRPAGTHVEPTRPRDPIRQAR